MVEVQKSEFKARRERLLAQMDKNSVAIIPAASEVVDQLPHQGLPVHRHRLASAGRLRKHHTGSNQTS